MTNSLWINNQSTSAGEITIAKGQKIPISKVNYPNDANAEQAVLGAMLMLGLSGGDTQLAMQNISSVSHEDFFYYHHGVIWRSMCKVNEKKERIDPQTVRTQLNSVTLPNGGTYLDFVGGDTYLQTIMKNVKGLAIESYATQVQRISLRRLHQFMSERSAAAYGDQTRPFEDALQEVEAIQMLLSQRMRSLSKAKSVDLIVGAEERVKEVLKEMRDPNHEPAISTGIKALDNAIIGWQPKRLYCVTGPQGWGKTVVLMNFAINAAKLKKRVLFITFEMDDKEFLDRAICNMANISYERFQKGQMLDQELKDFITSSETIAGLIGANCLTVVHMVRPTIKQVAQTLASHSLEPGFDLVIMDYIKETKFSGVKGDEKAGTDEILSQLDEWVENEFKHAPFIVGAQLNRSYKLGERYTSQQLYGTGLWADICDVILGIWRPYEVDRSTSNPYEAYFMPLKTRNVYVTHDIPFFWDGAHLKIGDDESTDEDDG